MNDLPWGAPLRLMLDVDHIDPDRWIVVIDAQAGPFSTETGSARHVDTAARDAVAEVLHVVDVELSFVDIDGHPRSPPAEARAARLPRRPLQSPSDSGERPLVDRGDLQDGDRLAGVR